MLNWRNWFPALSYFSPDEEQEFRLKLYQRTRLATTRVAWLMVFLICIYILLDVFKWQDEYWPIEIMRVGAIVCTLGLIGFIRYSDISRHQFGWQFISLLYVAFNLALFYQSILIYGTIGPGAPMLSVVVFAIIPVLHLGQKMLVWLAIGFGFVIFQLWFQIDLSLTLIYYGLTVLSTTISQFQRDRLLRHNYRAEVAEREKAKMDALTGLYNRRGLEAKVNQLLQELKGEEKLALGIVDVDFFKRYNDHYGHLQGDVALQSIAACLTELDVDMVVRFGGEEFIVLKRYKWSEPDWVKAVCQNIESLSYAHSQSPFGHLTVSMGVVKVGEHHAPKFNASQLLAKADASLYQAKDQGRNQVVMESLL